MSWTFIYQRKISRWIKAVRRAPTPLRRKIEQKATATKYRDRYVAHDVNRTFYSAVFWIIYMKHESRLFLMMQPNWSRIQASQTKRRSKTFFLGFLEIWSQVKVSDRFLDTRNFQVDEVKLIFVNSRSRCNKLRAPIRILST